MPVMQNRFRFVAGDSVIKNPAGWIASASDTWGAGTGVGIVGELLTEFDDGDTVDVRWPNGRAFQRLKELFLVEPRDRSSAERRSDRRLRTPIAFTRLLMIDDDLNAIWLLSKLLARHGCDVRFTDKPHEALEFARAFRPHAVCVEIGMHVMDGYTLARSLRQLPGMQDCTIIAMAGHPPDRRRMQMAGFNMHLLKPVGASLIAETVRDLASTTGNRESTGIGRRAR
jgi:CheY-like chemotaxis protein